jgi:aspartate/methionine/tyrosine aminotransferase
MSMDGVLRLYFGESNLATPDYIKRAAAEALAAGYTYYTENAGLPSLRRALAAHYRKLHQVELDPAGEIVITASGVQALSVAIRALLDPGDEALVLTPAWPNGSAIVTMSNAVAVEIPHPLAGERYAVDFAALEAAVTPRTRMLLYTSPSNPLGWVATEEEQQRLLDFCRERGLWLMTRCTSGFTTRAKGKRQRAKGKRRLTRRRRFCAEPRARTPWWWCSLSPRPTA